MQICLIFSKNSTILDKFNYEIKQNELYAEDSKTIDALVREMATRKIRSVGKLNVSLWLDRFSVRMITFCLISFILIT